MEIDACLKAFETLKRNLSRRNAKTVNTEEERSLARAVVEAWFREFRPSFTHLLSDESIFLEIDHQMQTILNLSTSRNLRSRYLSTIRNAIRGFKALYPDLKASKWANPSSHASTTGDHEVIQRLGKLDKVLLESYEQVIYDLKDLNRRSFRGTANELREVLRSVLDKLAPDAEVEKADWCQRSTSRNKEKQKPTRAEKTKFILKKQRKDSAVSESIEEHLEKIEVCLSTVVNASYRRASDASHRPKEKEEVEKQLKYMNLLLLELLPI